MSMIHHAGGPGRGVTVNEIYQNFFWRGSTTIGVGHVVMLDLRGEDGATLTFAPGGDPDNAGYPNDHIFRNCVTVTAAGELSGIMVLVTDLKTGAGATDTEFRGALIAYNVDVLVDASAGNVVKASSQIIMDVGSSTVDTKAFVDGTAGGGEKVIAIPHAAVTTDGANLGKMFFNGVEGFGSA